MLEQTHSKPAPPLPLPLSLESDPASLPEHADKYWGNVAATETKPDAGTVPESRGTTPAFREEEHEGGGRQLHKQLKKQNSTKWTSFEELQVLLMHKKYKNNWTAIASSLPGRTNSTVKNRFYSIFRKVKNKVLKGNYHYTSKHELLQIYYMMSVFEDYLAHNQGYLKVKGQRGKDFAYTLLVGLKHNDLSDYRDKLQEVARHDGSLEHLIKELSSPYQGRNERHYPPSHPSPDSLSSHHSHHSPESQDSHDSFAPLPPSPDVLPISPPLQQQAKEQQMAEAVSMGEASFNAEDHDQNLVAKPIYFKQEETVLPLRSPFSPLFPYSHIRLAYSHATMLTQRLPSLGINSYARHSGRVFPKISDDYFEHSSWFDANREDPPPVVSPTPLSAGPAAVAITGITAACFRPAAYPQEGFSEFSGAATRQQEQRQRHETPFSSLFNTMDYTLSASYIRPMLFMSSGSPASTMPETFGYTQFSPEPEKHSNDCD